MDADGPRPPGPGALLREAGDLVVAGRIREAQALLLRCCRTVPDRPELWELTAATLLATGDTRDADEALAEAARLRPRSLSIELARADVAMRDGTARAALDRLAAACMADPFDVAALTARGVLLAHLGEIGQSVDLLEAASLLAPDDAGPALALANVLIHTDRMAQAEAALDRAVALAPDQWLLRNNRAVVQMRRQRLVEARAEFEALIAAHGEQPGPLGNLSNVLTALGDQDAGAAAARRATEIAPDLHLAWRSLCNALAYHPEVDGMTMRATAEAASARIARTPAAGPSPSRSPDPHRRLRVGLLSLTLKTHPVGWLTVAGFENLDPDAFEIVCCAQPQSGDPIARRFASVAGEWRVVEGLDIGAVTQTVRAADVDILIDLGGYGDRGLLPACAQRLAPVQIKWVGMQNHSTGLPEIDWFLTDRWETPAGFERLYTERLLRLPDGYVCYSPPPYAPDVAPLPALRNGAMTFGCFNNLSKITPAVIAAWSEIMRQLPDAKLMLATHQLGHASTRARLHDVFAAHGIAAERVALLGGMGHRDLLARYNEVDMVLDPFPYTGGLTTCEALWMGVPTVTVAGELFSSLHSTSHLSNVGLGDWIAQDTAGYVAQALRRARNVDALASLRARLRGQVKSSPLCDAPRFGRNLGAALREVWRDWCETQTHPGQRHCDAPRIAA